MLRKRIKCTWRCLDYSLSSKVEEQFSRRLHNEEKAVQTHDNRDRERERKRELTKHRLRTIVLMRVTPQTNNIYTGHWRELTSKGPMAWRTKLGRTFYVLISSPHSLSRRGTLTGSCEVISIHTWLSWLQCYLTHLARISKLVVLVMQIQCSSRLDRFFSLKCTLVCKWMTFYWSLRGW